MNNGSPPGHNLDKYYAGWREKEDKYFLQVREKIILSKNLLSCEEKTFYLHEGSCLVRCREIKL